MMLVLELIWSLVLCNINVFTIPFVFSHKLKIDKCSVLVLFNYKNYI